MHALSKNNLTNIAVRTLHFYSLHFAIAVQMRSYPDFGVNGKRYMQGKKQAKATSPGVILRCHLPFLVFSPDVSVRSVAKKGEKFVKK